MTITDTTTNSNGTGAGVDALTRVGTVAHLDEEVLRGLAAVLDGELVRPGDDSYEIDRRVWNGMIDVFPALVVKCAGTADVRAAVDFARSHDIVMSVRGGGHNAAGVAVVDRGLVVDLTEMKAVEVDPSSGIVRVQGGVTIGELDAATAPHGLVVPQGVVTETGVAGLTLGGGLGWLRRKFGLACDNLVGAEVVTADGRVVSASEDENPELLWGLRGGGGNFGVVTRFDFRAHAVGPDVHFAVLFHGGDDAVEALRFYREWAADAPDEISAIAVTWHAPEIEEIPEEHHGEPVVVFLAVHAGSPAEGEVALRSFREFGSPIADLSSTMPWVEVQQFFDEDYPKWEKRYYWTSAYVTELPDDLIERLVELNANAPSDESNVDVWQLGGAMARVPADATAFGDRSPAFMFGIEANWEDAGDDAANIAWAREVREAAEPWATGARYANFPGMYEEGEAPDFFGANRDRMAALKAEYDPDNVFDRNHNVAPAPAG